uniref:Putative secreted protein n=1 Tax=Rhipicephalus microplus TaxID=6941 RepID=A0A6M2DD90_RHIMP
MPRAGAFAPRLTIVASRSGVGFATCLRSETTSHCFGPHSPCVMPCEHGCWEGLKTSLVIAAGTVADNQ